MEAAFNSLLTACYQLRVLPGPRVNISALRLPAHAACRRLSEDRSLRQQDQAREPELMRT